MRFWRFAPAPSGKTKCRCNGLGPQRPYPRKHGKVPRAYPRVSHHCGRSVEKRPPRHPHPSSTAYSPHREVNRGSIAGSSRRDERRLGAAPRRIQPPLGLRDLPTDQTHQGSSQRSLAGPSTPRRSHRPPDRPAARRRRPRPRRSARRGRHRPARDDRHDAARRPLRAGRLCRHGGQGPDSGDDPFDPHGRRPGADHRLGDPSRGRPRRSHRADRSVDHRVPDRHRRGLHRRGRRLRLRQHGQPPRLPWCRHEMDQAGHRRCGRPRRAAGSDADQDAGRDQRPRRRPARARPSTPCTPCARMPAARSTKARSSTAASSAPGTPRASG